MTENLISEAVNSMIKTNRLHKQLLDLRVSEIGLHRTEHRALMHLHSKKHIDSQKMLAEHLGITPAAVTGVLKRLEKAGLIERKQGNDNRYNEIIITKKGNGIVERSWKLFEELDRSMFSDFTEDELRGYIAYLDKIRVNIMKNNNQMEEDKR